MKIKTTVRGGMMAINSPVPIVVNPRRGCGTGGIVRPVLTTAILLA
jgi:hypothetical protein